MKIILRQAEKEDLQKVLELIKELAEYEKAPEQVSITLQELENDGFAENPLYEIIIAEKDGQIAGMSFFYFSYSTWKGKCLFLEDIIVKEKFRGQGIGTKLFDATLKRAKETKAKRMQWQVLNWNKPAINFYEKYNAEFDNEWINCKFTEEQILKYKTNN